MRLTQIRHDLWETSPFSPFDGLITHAYLWTPPSGHNVLFYAPGNEEDFADIDALGGVAHEYLSHLDEAGPALKSVADHFGSSLHSHRAERDSIARFVEPDVLFDDRFVDTTGVEVIPTPGHSPGSTCYVVDSGDERYLFVGDTIFHNDEGRWGTFIPPGRGEPEQLAASLELMGTLRPTVVVSSAAGKQPVTEIDPDTWADQMARTAERLTD